MKKRYRGILLFASLLHLSIPALADWQHTLYGSIPSDCIKIRADELDVFKCREEVNFPTEVQQQFRQLDQFFDEDEQAKLDAKYEVALLRKLADPRAASILEASSEYALLEFDDPKQLKDLYQTLPSSCIRSFPKTKELSENHNKIVRSLTPKTINQVQQIRIQSLIEDLSYIAQLRASKKELMNNLFNRQKSDSEKLQMKEAIKAIDKLLEMMPMKDPLLEDEQLKRIVFHPKYQKTLEDPTLASTSKELRDEVNKRMKSAASQLRKKLVSNKDTGLRHLCSKMQGELEDLVYHRFARGVKEADFIDSLLSQEEQLNQLTTYRIEDHPNNSKEQHKDNLNYHSLMGSAACRLKLKVINNSSVDLVRDFAINAGLTIGTAGLSSIATGLSVGSKVIVAANTGRNGRIALAGITALDLGTAAFIEGPQVYDNCIKGNVNQDRYFINSDITPLSCGLSIGMASVSRIMGTIGLKNTIKAFKNDRINTAYLQAIRGNLFAQSDESLKSAYQAATKQIDIMANDELLTQASSIARAKVLDLETAKELVRNKLIIESLPVPQREAMLKLSLQSTGSIPPKGEVPSTVSKALKQAPEVAVVQKREVIEEAVEVTALPSSTTDDILSQGHMGTLPRSSLIHGIKERVDLKFRFSQIVDDEKGARFLKLFQSNSDARQKALFFNVENSVQKALNDQYIVDKEVVDALNDHYKRLIYQEIKSNQGLNSALMGEFNDFKSLKLAFDKSKMSTNALNSQLNAIFKKVNNDFASYCNQLGVKGLLTKDGKPIKGMVGDPRHWFIAGTGDSVDMSSIFARLSRKNYQAGKNSTVITGKHYAKQLKELAAETEQMRTKVEQILRARPEAMKEGILDEELVAILRKSGQKGYGEEYFQLVRSKVKAAYQGLELSNDDITSLRSYYNAADTFSPPVLSATRVTHDLDKATGDIISFDYRGIGALNGQSNMRALKEWDGESMDQLAKLIRHHDDSVTNRLVALREKATTQSIENAFSEIRDILPDWQKSNITYSGDDGILKIPAEVKLAYVEKFGTLAEKKYQEAIDQVYQQSVSNLQRIGERADRVRITRLNAPDMRRFGQVEIGEQISKQEGIEKGIRDFLLGKIPSKEDFLISVESHIDAHGSITYRVINRNATNQLEVNKLIEEYTRANQIPMSLRTR